MGPELVPVTLGPVRSANSRAALRSPAGVHPLKADRGSPTAVSRRFTSWRQKAQNGPEQLSPVDACLLPASVDPAEVSHISSETRGLPGAAMLAAPQEHSGWRRREVLGVLIRAAGGALPLWGAPGHRGSAPLAYPPPQRLFRGLSRPSKYGQLERQRASSPQVKAESVAQVPKHSVDCRSLENGLLSLPTRSRGKTRNLGFSNQFRLLVWFLERSKQTRG